MTSKSPLSFAVKTLCRIFIISGLVALSAASVEAGVFPEGYTRTGAQSYFATAELVLVGRVAHHWADFDPQNNQIRTFALVEVEYVRKGSLGDKVITISVRGGAIGDLRWMHSVGNVEFADGERVELMLKYDPDRGHYVLAPDPFGYRSLQGGKSKPGGRIKRFATTFGFGWGAGKVIDYYVNSASNLPSGVTGAQFLAAVQAAVLQWQMVADVAWSFKGASTKTQFNTPQTLDQIHFFWKPDIPEIPGSIGLAAVAAQGGKIVLADVAFDQNDPIGWTTTPATVNKSDVQSTVTHEAGHALGMAHSSDGQATMWTTQTAGTSTWRSLNPDDIAGIRSLYGAIYRIFLPLLKKP